MSIMHHHRLRIEAEGIIGWIEYDPATMIEEVTDRLLDAVVDKGEMDAVAEFAVGLPMTIIAYALGVGFARLVAIEHDPAPGNDDLAASPTVVVARDMESGEERELPMSDLP